MSISEETAFEAERAIVSEVGAELECTRDSQEAQKGQSRMTYQGAGEVVLGEAAEGWVT